MGKFPLSSFAVRRCHFPTDGQCYTLLLLHTNNWYLCKITQTWHSAKHRTVWQCWSGFVTSGEARWSTTTTTALRVIEYQSRHVLWLLEWLLFSHSVLPGIYFHVTIATLVQCLWNTSTSYESSSNPRYIQHIYLHLCILCARTSTIDQLIFIHLICKESLCTRI